MLGAGAPEDQLVAAAAGIPLVSIARPMKERVDWVSSVDRHGMTRSVDHLVDLGHEKVLFAAAEGAAGVAERRAGFEAAVAQHGVEGTMEFGRVTEIEGADFAARMLERDRVPTAVTALNDRAPRASMDPLVSRGVRRPAGSSIAGHDGTEIARR